MTRQLVSRESWFRFRFSTAPLKKEPPVAAMSLVYIVAQVTKHELNRFLLDSLVQEHDGLPPALTANRPQARWFGW